MAKYYVHKSKFMKTLPIFKAFCNEFLLYCKSLKCKNSKYASERPNCMKMHNLSELE